MPPVDVVERALEPPRDSHLVGLGAAGRHEAARELARDVDPVGSQRQPRGPRVAVPEAHRAAPRLPLPEHAHEVDREAGRDGLARDGDALRTHAALAGAAARGRRSSSRRHGDRGDRHAHEGRTDDAS
jgi:hypothetical protein